MQYPFLFFASLLLVFTSFYTVRVAFFVSFRLLSNSKPNKPLLWIFITLTVEKEIRFCFPWTENVAYRLTEIVMDFLLVSDVQYQAWISNADFLGKQLKLENYVPTVIFFSFRLLSNDFKFWWIGASQSFSPHLAMAILS